MSIGSIKSFLALPAPVAKSAPAETAVEPAKQPVTLDTFESPKPKLTPGLPGEGDSVDFDGKGTGGGGAVAVDPAGGSDWL